MDALWSVIGRAHRGLSEAHSSVPDEYFFYFVYNKTNASFTEPLPTDPPYSCIVCAHCKERLACTVAGRIVHRAGGVQYVHCKTFQVGDFCIRAHR